MATGTLPSKEIIVIARQIQYAKTQVFTPTYQQPPVDYIVQALLMWLDEYVAPQQLQLPIIQIDDDGEKKVPKTGRKSV